MIRWLFCLCFSLFSTIVVREEPGVCLEVLSCLEGWYTMVADVIAGGFGFLRMGKARLCEKVCKEGGEQKPA